MHLCVGGGDAQAHAHLETASCRERRDAEGPSGEARCSIMVVSISSRDVNLESRQ